MYIHVPSKLHSIFNYKVCLHCIYNYVLSEFEIMYIIAVHSARPLLKDLQNNITPYYAAHWTVIGTQLGIHSGILQGIQASYPADAFRCCNKMLEIWLDTDCNATWDKIYKAIESPGVTKANLNLQQDNGMFRIIVCNYLCT